MTLKGRPLEIAREIILRHDAEVQAAGAGRNSVKLKIYDELRSKGLNDYALLLMTYDAVTRANMANPTSIVYNFNDSKIANANFGTQLGHITASLTAIGGIDQARVDFTSALKQLTEAVVNSTELTDPQKKEALEVFSFLGKEAESPADQRRMGVLRPVFESIPKILSSGAALVNLWHTFGPHITSLFGP